MDKHPINDLMAATMEKLREIVDVNTIIGQPIVTPDGVTLLPVSKVSLGFASGGSDFASRQSNQSNNFGGGSGAGINITPIAFIVISEGHVKVLNIIQDSQTSFDKLIDSAPELIDKISALAKKEEAKPDLG